MTRRRRLIGLALVACGALGVLRWFDMHPIELTVRDAETVGTPEIRDVPADVLVVVDHAVIARSAAAHSFEALDLSYGWANLARQEFGHFALVDATALGVDRHAAVRAVRAVVVTGSAVSAVSPRDVESFLAGGGTVLVERPDAAWAKAAGVHVAEPVAAGALDQLPRVLTLEDPSGVTAAELRAAPLPTTVAALEVIAPDTEVRLGVDGRPAWTTRRVGRGRLHATGLDVGRLVTALQQGVPTAGGLGVANRFEDRLSPYQQTCDLVADERLLDADVPYADLLERLFAHLLDDAGPLPRWWAFPDAAPGAYVATHDEESMGDVATWMADAEREWDVAGTDYVIAASRFTAEGAAQLGGDDRTLGLHYVTTLATGAPRHELGVGRILPFVRRYSLAEQAAEFESMTGFRPRSNRNHYLLWGDTWAGDFRRFAAAGIELDTSYGPDVDSLGYLFGTGLPFGALDGNGLPLPVDELPLLAAENLGGADRDFLFGLLRDSASRHHQVVTTLFHPNVFLWRPDAAIYEQWRDAFHEARRLGLWITHVDALIDHERARQSSSMTSIWSGGRLDVHAVAARDGLTLAVPARSAASTLQVEIDGEARAIDVDVETVGGRLFLIPLSSGPHRVTVLYGLEDPPR